MEKYQELLHNDKVEAVFGLVIFENKLDLGESEITWLWASA